MLDLFRTSHSHRHGAFHKRKAPDLHFFCINARQCAPPQMCAAGNHAARGSCGHFPRSASRLQHAIAEDSQICKVHGLSPTAPSVTETEMAPACTQIGPHRNHLMCSILAHSRKLLYVQRGASRVFQHALVRSKRYPSPPVREKHSQMRTSAHLFRRKKIWLDSGESHKVSGLFRFSNSATDHLLEKGPQKMPVPVCDTMTDRVRMAWIRTLRGEKLISIWPKTNKTVLLQSNRTVSSASKVQDPGASHDPDVYSFIMARRGEFFVVQARPATRIHCLSL